MENQVKCNKCAFVASKSDLNEHFQSEHGQKYVCQECGDLFLDKKVLGDHFLANHDPPKYIEPFPCEVCGLVFANFNLLRDHAQSHHAVAAETCGYCATTFENREDLHSHMIENHEEVVILCTMAKQIDKLSDDVVSFETFKKECTDTMKLMLNNQNKMMQELSKSRNDESKTNKPKETAPSPTKDKKQRKHSNYDNGKHNVTWVGTSHLVNDCQAKNVIMNHI